MTQPAEHNPGSAFGPPGETAVETVDATVASIKSHVDDVVEKVRHPLGWPKGSVRAVLALSTAACVYILLGMGRPVGENLLSTLFIILGYYFAVRVGEGPSGDKPLGLPKGTIRTLLALGFLVGVGFWLYHVVAGVPDVRAGIDAVLQDPLWPVVANLGAFLGGRVVRLILLKFKSDAQTGFGKLFGDIKAIGGLIAAAGVIIAFLTPLTEGLDPEIRSRGIGGLLALVTFYYGTR